MPKFVLKEMESLYIEEVRKSINTLMSHLESLPVLKSNTDSRYSLQKLQLKKMNNHRWVVTCSVCAVFVPSVCVLPSVRPSHCFTASITGNANQGSARKLPTGSHHCRRQLSMANWQIALLPLSLCLYTTWTLKDTLCTAYTALILLPSPLFLTFFRLTTFSILISLFARPLCLPLEHSFLAQRANQFSNCFASYPQRENWRRRADRACT